MLDVPTSSSSSAPYSPHIHRLQNAQASHHILRPKHALITLPPLLLLPLDLILLSLSLSLLLPTHDQDLEGVDPCFQGCVFLDEVLVPLFEMGDVFCCFG